MIDKEKLYPTFLAGLTQSRKLRDLATRKALDLPLDDDVNITTNKGVSGGALLGCVGFASAAAVAIAYMLSGEPAPAPPADHQVEFTIEHFDQYDKPIHVPAAE